MDSVWASAIDRGTVPSGLLREAGVRPQTLSRAGFLG